MFLRGSVHYIKERGRRVKYKGLFSPLNSILARCAPSVGIRRCYFRHLHESELNYFDSIQIMRITLKGLTRRRKGYVRAHFIEETLARLINESSTEYNTHAQSHFWRLDFPTTANDLRLTFHYKSFRYWKSYKVRLGFASLLLSFL